MTDSSLSTPPTAASTDTSPYDCVVIGGGIAGLSCAYLLAKSGVNVVVLEARQRVGGRTCTVHTKDGHNIDVGGAYVGPTQDRMLRLASELRVEVFPVYLTGKTITQVGPGTRAEYTGVIPAGLSPVVLLDLNALLVKTEALANTVDPSSPHTAPDAVKYDNMSAEQWIVANASTRVGAELYRSAVKSILCKSGSDVSMLFWLQIIVSGGGVELLMEHAQRFKFVEGSHAVSQRMADKLGPRVVLNAPVRTIDRSGAGAVTLTTRTGDVYTARRVVVAMPPSMWGKLEWVQPLPRDRLALSAHMPMGSIVKTITMYKEAWWRDAGWNGMALMTDGPVIYTYDDSGKDCQHPALMGFCLADHSSRWGAETVEARSLAIAQQYAKVFQDSRALDVTAYVEKDWSAEEFSGGCYMGVATPRALTEFGASMRDPMGRVHWAGTETAQQWQGYMEGAVQSGERAAVEVCTALQQEDTDLGVSDRKLLIPEVSPTEPPSPLIPHPKKSFPSALDKCLPSPRTFLVGLCSLTAVGLFALSSSSSVSGSSLSASITKTVGPVTWREKVAFSTMAALLLGKLMSG